MCKSRRHYSEVVEMLKEKRTGNEIEFKMPHRCPECGSETIRVPGESAYAMLACRVPLR